MIRENVVSGRRNNSEVDKVGESYLRKAGKHQRVDEIIFFCFDIIFFLIKSPMRGEDIDR